MEAQYDMGNEIFGIWRSGFCWIICILFCSCSWTTVVAIFGLGISIAQTYVGFRARYSVHRSKFLELYFKFLNVTTRPTLLNSRRTEEQAGSWGSSFGVKNGDQSGILFYQRLSPALLVPLCHYCSPIISQPTLLGAEKWYN